MCGRAQLRLTWEELASLYELEPWTIFDDLDLPLLNVAPTQILPVVTLREGRRALRPMRWGFPALWLARDGKDPWRGPPLINAKAEEAAAKPTWAAALRARRCLVPTTGFYEWLKVGKARYPLWFRPVGAPTLTLAGLWGEFEREGRTVACLSILTTAANGTVAPVHDRMPVLLAPTDWDRWLDPRTSGPALQALLQPAPDDALEAIEVGTALNAWQTTDPAALTPDLSRAALQGAPASAGRP